MENTSVKIGPHIKAIVWDLDGTIINSFHIMKALVREIALEEGLPIPSSESFLINYHGTLRETIHTLLAAELTDAELDRLMDKFLLKQVRYYDSVAEHLIEDAVGLLKRARHAGLKQVLVTNRLHAGHANASPRAIVASSVLKNYLDTIICGDDAPVRKPDPNVLAAFLKENGLSPKQVLIVGDQFVDAQLAMNLGTQCVLVNRDRVELAHMEKLGDNWQDHLTIVQSLHDVYIANNP